MIYTIHQINHDFIVGSVQDIIQDDHWIVVADIPRQMIRYNGVQPSHIVLISGKTDEGFSKDFEEYWTAHLAKRLRNWLVREHSEKLYPYQNQQVNIYYVDTDYRKPEDFRISSTGFFNKLVSGSFRDRA